MEYSILTSYQILMATLLERLNFSFYGKFMRSYIYTERKVFGICDYNYIIK